MGKLIKVWDGSTWQDVSVLAASSADKVSKSGGDTITSVTASTKGLSIQGAASQTANLQEWLNSAGTVLSSIASNGNGKFNGILIGQTAASASPSNISIGDSNTGASLTSTSTANVFIGSNAGASVGGYSNNTLIGHSAGRYNYGQYNTFLGSSTGILNGGGGGHNNVYIGYQAGYSGVGTGNVMIGYTAGQNTPGSNQLVIANSNISTPLIGGDFSVKTLTFAGNVTITSQATGTSGLIVKGAASQTASLTEWQDSAGTVLASIGSGGFGLFGANFQINGDLRVGPNNLAKITSIIDSATKIGLVVRGAASQTANLQQWQNSAGTVLANVDSAGKLTAIPSDGTISTAATNVGYMGIPQNSITTGAYTVVAADAGEHIYSSATRTITIDSNANLALPVGTVLTFISGAGATTTIAITSDTMYLAGAGTTGSRTLAPHGMATAVKVASTTWYISGNGLT